MVLHKRKGNFPEDAPKKRKTIPTSSSSDLLDIASIKDCVKLGTMNKINHKNAWNLRLLDYIDTVLDVEEKQSTKHPGSQRTNNSEQNDSSVNFQFASNTLDASVKIYACRVDNVHNETYKVLGGLARSDKEKENQQESSSSQETEETGEHQSNTDGDNRKAKKRRAALGSTLEKNVANLNTKKVDTAIQVDPLFHKTSAAFDEGGAKGLLLGQLGVSEGGNVVFDSAEYHKEKINFSNEETYDLDVISGLVDTNWESYNICDAFTNFSFVWENEKNSSCYLPGQDLHNLDIQAEDNDDAYEYENFTNFADNMDAEENDSDNNLSNNENEDDMISKILGAGSIVPDFDLVNLIGEGTGEFDYFNKRLVQNWAGPDHWRFQKTRPVPSSKPLTAKSKPRKKKEDCFLDFFAEEEIPKGSFRRAKSNTTTLTLSVLEKEADTILPPDVHYEVSMLTKLFTKPERSVGFRRIDDVLRNYEDDNASAPTTQFPTGQAFDDYPEPDYPQNDFAPAFEGSQSLISAPDKVAMTHINYAKKSANVDIEKLRSSIWKELQSRGGTSPTEPNTLSSPVSFDKMVNELPNSVPETQMAGVSVPLCFICLLDLANKKQLQIDQSENDLVVTSYQVPCN